MPTIRIMARIARLMPQLMTNAMDRPSGSGNKPKVVLSRGICHRHVFSPHLRPRQRRKATSFKIQHRQIVEQTCLPASVNCSANLRYVPLPVPLLKSDRVGRYLSSFNACHSVAGAIRLSPNMLQTGSRKYGRRVPV